MASITYQKDRRSGSTYAYRVEQYRDPQTGRARTRREYLGRLDPATGTIVPKAAPGRRNRSSLGEAPAEGSGPAELARALSESRGEVERLREVVRELRERNSVLESTMRSLLDAMSSVGRALDGAREAREALGLDA